jgi:Carboxypeptidase regulatory-like domain
MTIRKSKSTRCRHCQRRFALNLGFAAVTLLAAWFIIGAGASAQTSQGITGVVTDPTGAVIPKAKITVHNEETGVDTATTATATGNYFVPFLHPGIYDVTAGAHGFQNVQKTKVTLETDQTVTVNFTLTPGSVSQSVTVNASSDVLDYTNANRGETMEGISVTQLPIQAEDAFTLTQQVAGTYNNLNPTEYGPYNQQAQDLSIHANQVQLNVDGLDNQSMNGSQNYQYDPPEGTLQEFTVETEPYDAAAGRSSGGDIDMTLKTGGKTLHGVAYELMRPGFVQANTSVNDAERVIKGPLQSLEVPAQHYDQYGFEIDGPVIIPKLWHGNRQTFFVISWQHINQAANTTVTGSVPTQAMIGKGTAYPGEGDFSSLLTANGATYNQPIYDPTSEAACTANNTDNGTYKAGNPHNCRYQYGYGPGASPGPKGNPVLIGTPNVIPAGKMSSVAENILSWYAYPNSTPSPSTANDFNDNYFQNNPSTYIYNNYLIKLDQDRGSKDQFDFQFRTWTVYGTNINGDPRDNVNPSHPGLNEAGYGAHFNNYLRELGFASGWTHIFSPTLVNSIKAEVNITDQTDNTGPPDGFNPSNLGFPASMAGFNPQYFDRFPSITVGNYNVLGSISGLERGDNEIDAVDTFNWTHGNHTIHFGGEFMPYQYSQRISNASGNSINLSVGKGWTQQWDIVTTGGSTGISSSAGYSGNSVASMEAGTWDSGNATTQPNNFYSLKYGAAFFQDDWRVKPNLTLNLGVRWEKPIAGDIDRENRQVYDFDSTDVNPINGIANTSGLPINGALLGGITFAGVDGNPRSPWKVIWYDYSPRAGFAYALNSKTVIRGGMGIFYSMTGNQYQPPQTGYSSTTTYVGTPDGGITPDLNLANPFPTFQTPTGNCGGNKIQCLETNAGQTLSFYNPNFKFNPVLNSSFGIERQLTKWDTIEISFAGMRAYNTSYSDDLNHISAAAQAACDPERGGEALNCTQALGSTPAAGTSIGYVNNPFYGLAPFAASGTYYTSKTIQAINFTRPFPIFYTSNLAGGASSVTEQNLDGGKSWYNAGELTFTHRTGLGLTFHGTYTYSHLMSSSGYTDYVNRIWKRGIGGTDTPNRITMNGIYDLPIGRGRTYFSDMNRFTDAILGGWQVSSVVLIQSGIPFSIGGYEINKTANGGYLLPRKRFWTGNSNPYWPGDQGTGKNSYIQAFKPCVGTRDPNTGEITLEGYSVKAGCTAANFVQILSNYGEIPNVDYTGIRLQRIVTQDADLSKTFTLHERLKLQLRMDVFNAMNHVIQSSSGYDTSVSDSNFGTFQLGTSSGGNYPNRQYQFVGRLTW